MDTVYVIEQEFEAVGICDNELDVLRCLVLHGMIDLEKVNKELQAHNQPDYKDVVTWLAHGATIDDLSQFIENGTCYSQTINHDLGKQCSFDYLCKQEFNLNEYVVRFPDEHEFIVKATFLDEAKALALKERDEAGFDYELPKSVSFLPGRLSQDTKGVVINRLSNNLDEVEYVLDELHNLMVFKDEDSARAFLHQSDLTDEEIKALGIRFFRESDIRLSEKRLESLREAFFTEKDIYDLRQHWTFMEIERGYCICMSEGSEITIPNAYYVDRIAELDDIVFKTDMDALIQARKDGVPLIDDMPGIEKGVYLDTEENRRICKDCLAKHPEYRIEHLFDKLDPDYRKMYVKEYGPLENSLDMKLRALAWNKAHVRKENDGMGR